MTNQPTYNQPPMQGPGMAPQGPMQQRQVMPPQMPPRQGRLSGRQARWAQWLASQQKILITSFPKWFPNYVVGFYIASLLTVSAMYSAHSLPWYYMLSGVLGIIIFFIYGSKVVKDTSVLKIHKERSYEKRIFIIALIPRVLFMFLLYGIFMKNYGDSFGFENMDAVGYDELGGFVADLLSREDYHFYDRISKYTGHDDIADMGYAIYVGFIYWLTGKSIIAVRLLKCVWSSLTVVLIYRLTKRNFGAQTARVAAVFCALWPNFWYYCANHLKETEMVFLTVLFIEQADQMLRSKRLTAWKVIPVLLIAAALFTFRTVLAMVLILALLFTIVMSSTKVVSWGKRIIVGLLAVVLIGVTMGNRIEEQSRELFEQREKATQKSNMEWRANRLDTSGNKQKFAKYAGAAVFAPMIFTLPFPTMVRPFDGQELQQMLNGGYFTKNVLSFFTILAMVVLLLSGKWRDHLLPLSFMLGYLLVLTLSNFAHSDRFHHPAMPFEFMFATYGLSVALTRKKYKRWFTYWCVLMFIATIAWNWFKLAGRGLA